MNFISIPTEYAKRNNLAVFITMEFALLALLPSLSHQEAALFLAALNTVPKAALLVILALSYLTVFVLSLTASKSLDSLVLFALMATSLIHQISASQLTPTVK